MRDTTNSNTRGSDLLFRISCIICALYIIMRVILAGTGPFSPQDVLLNGLALLSLLTAVVSRLLSNGLILPRRSLLLVLFLALIAIGIAVLRAEWGGYLYPALALARDWIADGMIFLAVVITARERNVFRYYAATLGAGLSITGVYALYQKVYALGYLRDIALNSTIFRESMRVRGEMVAHAFIARIEDGWVGGGFGSDGALCAFSLLLVVFFFGLRARGKEFRFNGALFLGLIGIVLSGSICGILLGKIFEVWALYWLRQESDQRLKGFLLVSGGVGVMTLLSLILVFGVWLAVGSVMAGLVFAFLWYYEFELLQIRYGTGIYKPTEYLTGVGVLVVLLLLALVLFLAPAGSELADINDIIRHGVMSALYPVQSALEAFRDAPVVGWGLDNFSEIHAGYKHPLATGLGRAGNVYVDILADGGIILCLALLVLLGVILFTGAVERREHREIGSGQNRFKYFGSLTILGAFILSYSLVALGIFDHMGANYFFSELFGSPVSMLARNEDIAPLLIHFIVNFILLPCIGIYGFKTVWVISREMNYTAIERFLRLAVGVLLLYGLGVDVFYIPALGGIFWVVAGMLLARQRAWGMLNFRPVVSKSLSYLFIMLGLFWGTWVTWEGFVSSMAEKTIQESTLDSDDTAEIERGLAGLAKAISRSGGNAELYVQQGNLQLRLAALRGHVQDGEYKLAVESIRRGIDLRPAAAEYLVTLAKAMEEYAPGDNTEQIAELYLKAQRLYSLNSKFYYLYAQFLASRGDKAEAKVQAGIAIEKSTLYDHDPATRLRRYELYAARGIVHDAREE